MIAEIKNWPALLCLLIYLQISICQKLTHEGREDNSFFHEDPFQPWNRIVGGLRATIVDSPFIVSFIMKMKNQQMHFCAGAIISSEWVVTAAHCAEDMTNESAISVRSGSTVWNDGGDLHKVIKTISHPQYTGEGMLYNDIALVRVSPQFNFTQDTTKKITLPSKNYVIKTKSLATLFGWGGLLPQRRSVYNWKALTRKSQVYPRTLYRVELPIAAHQVCRKVMADFGKLKKSQICAGYIKGGKDSCQGDSGGPLIENDVLIGIVSWGKGCAEQNALGVYTKVSSFINWILKYAKKFNFDVNFDHN